MRRLASTIFILAISLLNPSAEGVVAQTANGPAGTWRVQTFRGAQRGEGGGDVSIVELHLAGQKLEGMMYHYLGSRTAIENGRYVDFKISFDVPRQWNGRHIVSHFSGSLVDGQLQGTVTREGHDDATPQSWTATRATAEEFPQNIVAPPVSIDVELSKENYEDWRDHILPHTNEMAWSQIPWLTTFKDGILAAHGAGKPLLLWTMNGHPLGCT